MKPVVLITGKMRSGTSLVAAIVHHLGFHAGALIPAPAPPSWRSDWEDPDLSLPLLLGREIDWPDYLEERYRQADTFGFHGVAIKSPYLAARWDEVRAALPGAIVVVVTRDERAVARSVAAHPCLSRADQRAIAKGLEGVRADFRVAYEDVTADPWSWTHRIASALSVDDDNLIHRAAALAGAPTEYV